MHILKSPVPFKAELHEHHRPSRRCTALTMYTPNDQAQHTILSRTPQLASHLYSKTGPCEWLDTCNACALAVAAHSIFYLFAEQPHHAGGLQ